VPRHSALLCALLWLAPAVGLAETSGAVAVRQFQPSPFADRELRLDGSTVLPAWKLQIGIDADYAWKPLVLTDVAPAIQQARKTNYDYIRHAVGADLTVALGLGRRLELGLQVPFTVFQSGEAAPGGVAPPGTAGVENPRIGVKAHLLGDGLHGLGLGAAALVALPLGAGGSYIHEQGLGGEARLFADYRADRLGAGLSGGYRLRQATHAYDVPVDDELIYAAGASLRVSQKGEVFTELAGATAAARPFRSSKQSPLELLFGGRRRLGADGSGANSFLGGNLWLTGAAGPGLISGYGSPLLRVVVGLAWSNRALAPCREAPCPAAPEPAPPPPPPKCPGGAGCPPEPPAAPADRDKDGILDDEDECPDEPEDKDGFDDEDGCPDPDNDKDGILDAQDKCPNEPETINGKDDDDGCPDQGDAEVRVGKEELETLKPIFFETDRSRVRHAFYNILGQIALTLKAHPEIGRCAVEGHTDDTGPPGWNQKLSVLRAEAVVEFLAGKGVDRKRLTAIGHGEKLPWAPNDTESGRAKNRRVIFHIEGADTADQEKQQIRQKVRAHKAAKAAGQPDALPAQRQAPKPAVKPAPKAEPDGAAKQPTLRELLKLPGRP